MAVLDGDGAHVSLYFWKQQTRQVRALEGHHVSSKSPSRVQDGDEEVAGRDAREKYKENEGSLICNPGKSMIYLQKRKQKLIELVARPGCGSVLSGGSFVSSAWSWATGRSRPECRQAKDIDASRICCKKNK